MTTQQPQTDQDELVRETALRQAEKWRELLERLK
jgi:hypothetical protein